MVNKMELDTKEAEYRGEKEGEKENEKTENFPRSLFIHDPWPVIRDILERRFSEMWNGATPVDIECDCDRRED